MKSFCYITIFAFIFAGAANVSKGAEKTVSGESVIKLIPANPVDGDEIGSVVLLDITEYEEADDLQGVTYRANTRRSGEYKTSGIPELKGLKWKFKTGDKIRCSPVCVDGKVYVGSHDGNFYCVDANTGKEIWEFETKYPIYSSPTVFDGIVYFGSNNGWFYALDALTGEKKWSVKGKGPTKVWKKETSTQGGGQPDVADSPSVAYGLVFVAINGHVRGFDLKTGEEKWADLRGRRPQQMAAHTIYQGGIFHTAGHVRIYGGLLRNGKTVLIALAGGCVGNTHAAADGYLYFLSINGSLKCLDRKNLKKKYYVHGGVTAGRNPDFNFHKESTVQWETYCSPAVGEGKVMFGMMSGLFVCINAKDGKELWSQKLPDSIRSSPSITKGIAYFGCHDGNIYALDMNDGKEIWKYKTGGPIISSPYIGDGVLYVGSDDGYLYCLE